MYFRPGKAGPRDPADDEASALLRALAIVQATLTRRAVDLRREPGFSNVTHELSIDGPTHIEDLPEEVHDSIRDVRASGSRQIVISGYVDAALTGGYGCAWLFHVAEGEAEGWSLSRTVTLYPPSGDNLEVDLPTVNFSQWGGAAGSLPGLIDELLATPLPPREC